MAFSGSGTDGGGSLMINDTDYTDRSDDEEERNRR
jgi:hypothetical protein